MEQTMALLRFSGSSPTCPAQPGAPARCSPRDSRARSPRRCRWRPERSSRSARKRRWPPANVEREREEITKHPEEDKEELSLFYQLKGIDEQTADELAERMARHPDAMLQALVAEEFGTRGTDSNPAQAALAAGISTGLGAIVPVIPFMITTGTDAIIASAVVSLFAHFLVGAAKSLVTLRTWWASGLEMTLAGVVVGGATYLVGLALPT
jgi:VIT1/CCC1 family predicted Fe2+/Mn2+ transporter